MRASMRSWASRSLQDLGGGLDVLFPLGAGPVHLRLDLVVGVGLEVLERQVFELPLDLPDAQAVGERGEDLQGLLGDLLLAVFGHRAERPHVVQAVGQLDDHDAQVLGHRQEDLAEVGGALVGLAVALLAGLGLRAGRGQFRGGGGVHAGAGGQFVAGLEVGELEFGDAVHQVGDLSAELGGDLVAGDAAVLHDVMQQPGGQGGVVHLQAREDMRDGEGVRDVGFAGAPLLVLVLVGGVGVGMAQQFGIGVRVVRLRPCDQRVNRLFVVVGHRRPNGFLA